MKILKLIKIPDLITLLSVILAMLSIFSSVQGNPSIAAILILASAVSDKLDGIAARMLKRKGDFGKHLDSLADAVAFGAAPAVLGFMILEKSIFSYFALILFVCAGILRLARFNISPNVAYFEGLPITASGTIMAVWILIGFPVSFLPYLCLMLSILMVSSIRIKKPGIGS